MRPSDDGLTVTSPSIPDFGELNDIKFTVWGLPESPSHTPERGLSTENFGGSKSYRQTRRRRGSSGAGQALPRHAHPMHRPAAQGDGRIVILGGTPVLHGGSDRNARLSRVANPFGSNPCSNFSRRPKRRIARRASTPRWLSRRPGKIPTPSPRPKCKRRWSRCRMALRSIHPRVLGSVTVPNVSSKKKPRPICPAKESAVPPNRRSGRSKSKPRCSPREHGLGLSSPSPSTTPTTTCSALYVVAKIPVAGSSSRRRGRSKPTRSRAS